MASLGQAPWVGSVPMRGFAWRRDQRHRPGLEYMVSTGRLHGFESLEEDWLLRALDFCGRVQILLSQPFRMRFGGGGGTPRIPCGLRQRGLQSSTYVRQG